jgi:hypothetical protein
MREPVTVRPLWPWRSGDPRLIQYLIDKGADLGAHELGKKNDGEFGSSVEPLMPIDYAIGVGTFVPNNAVIIHEPSR